MPVPGSGRSSLKLLLLASDALALVVSWLLSVALAGPSLLMSVAQWSLLGAISGIVAMAMLRHQGLYLARVSCTRVVEARGVLRAAAMAAVAALVIESFIDVRPQLRLSLIFAASAFLLILMGRGTYRAWIGSRRRRGDFVRPVLVVGANEEAAEFIEITWDHPELGYRVVGVLGNAAPEDDCPRVGGRVEDAVEVAGNLGASGAVVVASALTAKQLHDVTRGLLAAGVHVHVSSGLSGLSRTRVRPVSMAHQPLLYLESAGLGAWQRRLKRIMDVVLSSLLVVLSLPLWAAIAAAIKLESAGPVFFKQERVGRHGVPFSMVKFRTMASDAEEHLERLSADNERTGSPLFKMSADPRVTRVGRLLRATSLDELPQLLNVLDGTMSLVGPRPAMVHEIEQFDDELKGRLNELPGITGLWQVEARDHPSFGPYRRLDLFYVNNWSLSLDLLILAGTATSVVSRTLRSLLPFAGEASMKPL